MEKAFKLDFKSDRVGSLYANNCGCSQTPPLHSFGPASKPHYLIHYVLSGKGVFRFHDKEYRLEAGYGFLIQPNEAGNATHTITSLLSPILCMRREIMCTLSGVIS